MSEEFKSILDSSFDNGTPFFIYVKDYIYGMVPADPNGDRWIEVSYIFEPPAFEKKERAADLSYQFLFEELGKGINYYVEDFKVVALKEFAKNLESKPGPEKMKAVIAELINNSGTYSANLPIIKSKDELVKLKDKL